MDAYTANCGELGKEHIGKKVRLCGWCRLIRNHGYKLFVDLVDRYGSTQLLFEEESEMRNSIGKEYAIEVIGEVKKRDEETVDKSNPTGEIEVKVEKLKLLGKSKLPPFELFTEKKKFIADEELRLKYRFLDLRRREMLSNILFRDKATKIIRKYFWDNDFIEAETPILMKDTYETGSRTFLVPSRVKKGSFFALAQSPQIFKQLAMIGGLGNYFQIARCFRDEDPREDRQPEFTQVDLEVSFKDESYIQSLIEKLMQKLFKEMLNIKIDVPFPHLGFYEAMHRYGSDKPDLRFEMELIEVTEELKESEYKTVKRVVSHGGKAYAFSIDAKFDGKEGAFKENDALKLIEEAKRLGLGGLTWIYIKGGRIHSVPESIAESLKNAESNIIKKLSAKDGDIVVVGADMSESLLLSVLGKLRKEVGTKLKSFKSRFAFAWIDNFPLFEKDEVTGKLKPSHNPFTAPTDETSTYIDTDPTQVIGRQYDIVLNGYEIGGGSIRINDPDLQKKVFEKIGMQEESIERSFGFMLEALSYGAPTHGGIALGLDRLIAIMKDEENIREFILFPKNKKQELLVDGSPAPISQKRLKDDYGITTHAGQ
ncbi:MAG: aspartate--tRNA ligase [Candidatus Micrarchaeaceae archaeon]